MHDRPEVLSRLLQDHLTTLRVLALLEQEVDRIAQFHTPNTELLEDVWTFLSGPMNQLHHPIEDLIYGALKRRAPYRAQELEKIVSEHGEAGVTVTQFGEAVRSLLANPDGTRFAFCRVARGLIAFERHHLRREETRLFGYATLYLTPGDWSLVETAVQGLDALVSDQPGDNRFTAEQKKKIA